MNQNPSTSPETSPEFAGIAARATAGVRTHQNFLRVLTGTAFVLGFLAVAASVLIVCAYFVLYRPKEKEVLRQVTLAAEQAKARATPSDNEAAPPPKLPFDFPSVQATMTFFHSVVIAGLAAAVGILALGTLVLLAVVVLGRRATLQQINLSLTQISTQLRALQAAPGQK